MIQILKKIDVGRYMWDADHPVSVLADKAISVADTFYWIAERELAGASATTTLYSWHIGTESQMAVMQACKLANLPASDEGDLFRSIAVSLFSR